MKDDQIRKFVMFYERITKEMLKNFDKKANYIIKIDEKHRLNSLKLN